MLFLIFQPCAVGLVKIICQLPRFLRRSVRIVEDQDAGIIVLTGMPGIERKSAVIPVMQLIPDAVLAADIDDMVQCLIHGIMPGVTAPPADGIDVSEKFHRGMVGNGGPVRPDRSHIGDPNQVPLRRHQCHKSGGKDTEQETDETDVLSQILFHETVPFSNYIIVRLLDGISILYNCKYFKKNVELRQGFLHFLYIQRYSTEFYNIPLQSFLFFFRRDIINAE